MDGVWSVFIGSMIGGIVLLFWNMFKNRRVKKGLCPKCKAKLKKEMLENNFQVKTCPNGHGSADHNDNWYPLKK